MQEVRLGLVQSLWAMLSQEDIRRTMPIYPDYTPGGPHGSAQVGPGKIGESVNSSGDVAVENDVLLFEFENKKEGDQAEVWIGG
jgi:hypothetical protein